MKTIRIIKSCNLKNKLELKKMSKFSNSETTKLLKNLFTHSRCATHLQHFVLIYDIIIRSETWNSNATPLRILKLSDRTFPDPHIRICMHVLYVDVYNKLCGILHLSEKFERWCEVAATTAAAIFFLLPSETTDKIFSHLFNSTHLCNMQIYSLLCLIHLFTHEDTSHCSVTRKECKV